MCPFIHGKKPALHPEHIFMTNQNQNASEIINEAVHLLRASPFRLLPSYYVGTLPFVLGLLFFWADMSRNAFATSYCSTAAFGLAVLFVWMKFWQAIFAARIRALMLGESGLGWSFSRSFRLVVTQTIIQSTGFFVLPFALLLTLPFGWCYAFYQNVSALDRGESRNTKEICRIAWEQANIWPRQNHVLLAVLFLFSIFVFLNLVIAMISLPYMLKRFFGIETLFTMSGVNVLNTTFIASAFSMTYLCVDPLIKAAYALRCFYGTSLRTGDDLKAELGLLSRTRKILPLILIFLLTSHLSLLTSHFPLLPFPSFAAEHPHKVSADELDHAIQRVMEQRKFTWRMPREDIPKEKKDGPFASFMESLFRAVKEFFRTAGRWIDKISEWIDKLMPGQRPPPESPKRNRMPSAQNLLSALLLIAGVLLIVFFWQIWRTRQHAPLDTPDKAVPSEPDLKDEDIRPDELPGNRWLEIAASLAEKGELRLALRAFYLGMLALLADHEMITIARHKSNLDYEKEVIRRARYQQEIPSIFSGAVTFFEQVWYGMYEVSHEELRHFAENQKQLRVKLETDTGASLE